MKKVMCNTYFYARRLDSKALTLKQRLGVVAGSESGADAVLVVDDAE